MRACLAFVVVALTALLLGCGSESGTATSADATSSERTAAETTQAPREPDYPLPKLPPNRPPLEKLYIKDLEIGKGPVARWGDEVLTRYVAVYWKTGKIFTVEWGRESELFHFDLDPNGPAPGWQRGLHGMRVGGWRELRIPSDLLYDGGDAAYKVTLVRVRPGTAQ
jgi:peptidylprolyl isomerase